MCIFVWFAAVVVASRCTASRAARVATAATDRPTSAASEFCNYWYKSILMAHAGELCNLTRAACRDFDRCHAEGFFDYVVRLWHIDGLFLFTDDFGRVFCDSKNIICVIIPQRFDRYLYIYIHSRCLRSSAPL